MIEISKIIAGYGANPVLQEVDLEVRQGDLVAVIGPNGAGKTTLLRTISGLVRPMSGTITMEGKDLSRMDPDEIVGMGIIHVPEGRMVLTRMTVRENLMLGAFKRSDDAAVKRDFDHAVAMFPILGERIGQMAGTLSGGEQQMLAIARGLMGAPKLLMLDEPSLGIAPILVRTIFKAIKDIQEAGVTILMVEQNATKALAAADRAYALDLGSVTASGPADALLQDERVRQAYLGL